MMRLGVIMSLEQSFFDHYKEVTGGGALTQREKALIALAVAHSKQCPHCIDAYTKGCLESGSNSDQISEAIHVADAMETGMTLIHGPEMHNKMNALGAL